jgi:hypothetical protein
MLTEGATQLVVLDGDGQATGTVSLEAIAAVLSQDKRPAPA